MENTMRVPNGFELQFERRECLDGLHGALCSRETERISGTYLDEIQEKIYPDKIRYFAGKMCLDDDGEFGEDEFDTIEEAVAFLDDWGIIQEAEENGLTLELTDFELIKVDLSSKELMD